MSCKWNWLMSLKPQRSCSTNSRSMAQSRFSLVPELGGDDPGWVQSHRIHPWTAATQRPIGCWSPVYLELAVGFTLKVVGSLNHDLIGTWRLLSRIDRDGSGKSVDEPTLGSDPLALLFFDGAGNFAAQFMKRDRSVAVAAPVFTGQNNTSAIGGYDAYFGTYEVDETSGDVQTLLVGALSPGHVGATMMRNMKVEEGQLVIRLTTTTADDTLVHRTLIWERAG
jgi:Lipocalin-like domain